MAKESQALLVGQPGPEGDEERKEPGVGRDPGCSRLFQAWPG